MNPSVVKGIIQREILLWARHNILWRTMALVQNRE